MKPEVLPVFKPYEGTEPYVFISYSHKDSAQVFPILQTLHDRGLRVWYDKGIDPGSEWPEEIATHLLGCGLFLLFMSPEAAESHNVRREITMAIDKQKPLMNVYLRETELQPGLQLQLNLIQYVSYSSLDNQDFEEFIDRLAGILLKKAPGVMGEPSDTPEIVTPPVMPPPTPSKPADNAAPPPKPRSKAAVIAAAAVAIVFLGCLVAVVAIVFNSVDIPAIVDRALDDAGYPAPTAGTDVPAQSDAAASPVSGFNVTTSGANCYATLTGTGSLEFTNIFADKVTMPDTTDRVRKDYVIYDKDGYVTDFSVNSSSHGSSLAPGSRIVISLTNPSDAVDFFFPAALLDTAIAVTAFDTAAIRYVSLSGGGSLEFTNLSDIKISMPKAIGNARKDYAVYDKNGTATSYGASAGSYGYNLEAGSRLVVSPVDPAVSLDFYYPGEWADAVVSAQESDAAPLYYVTLNGGESLAFTNVSDSRADMPKASGNTRRDYTVYKRDGGEDSSRTDSSSHGYRLDPGCRIVLSLTNPAESLEFYFPAAMLGDVLVVEHS